jgi:hypothetical protein
LNSASNKTAFYQNVGVMSRNNSKNRLSNFFSYDSGTDITFNKSIVKTSKGDSTIKFNIVKDFSRDPLNSVIQKFLIPSGLPETPASVDAIAKGMGLPSGALSNSGSLASSLGISVQDLSNPNTKLSSETISAINKNRSYLGKELNIKNTTLGDYYNKALKSSILSGLNINEK